MFDMLTRDELCTLHTTLYRAATAIHERVMALPALNTDWDALTAHHQELAETMFAIDAELDRRAADGMTGRARELVAQFDDIDRGWTPEQMAAWVGAAAEILRELTRDA